MTIRRLRPSARACTIQTFRPDGWMRSPKPGSERSNRKVSLACGLLSRARRGVRPTVSMAGASLVLRAPSGQGRMDAVRHPVGGVRDGLVRKVGVAFRGLDERMAEQLGDGHHVHAVHGGGRSPAMAEVMKAQAGQARLVAEGLTQSR